MPPIEVVTIGVKVLFLNFTLEWNEYPNFCVTALYEDLPPTIFPDGDENVIACQSECSQRLKCSAIEWYESGYEGSKCKLIVSEKPATQGMVKPRWHDAVCYVKPIHTVSTIVGKSLCNLAMDLRYK